MEKKKLHTWDNPSAFPCTDTIEGIQRLEPLNTGMTLLDYFAGQAMAAIITGTWVVATTMENQALVSGQK